MQYLQIMNNPLPFSVQYYHKKPCVRPANSEQKFPKSYSSLNKTNHEKHQKPIKNLSPFLNPSSYPTPFPMKNQKFKTLFHHEDETVN